MALVVFLGKLLRRHSRRLQMIQFSRLK